MFNLLILTLLSFNLHAFDGPPPIGEIPGGRPSGMPNSMQGGNSGVVGSNSGMGQSTLDQKTLQILMMSQILGLRPIGMNANMNMIGMNAQYNRRGPLNSPNYFNYNQNGQMGTNGPMMYSWPYSFMGN